MLAVKCDRCNADMADHGGLVFSPPTVKHVLKYHVCVTCWKALIAFITCSAHKDHT